MIEIGWLIPAAVLALAIFAGVRLTLLRDRIRRLEERIGTLAEFVEGLGKSFDDRRSVSEPVRRRSMWSPP